LPLRVLVAGTDNFAREAAARLRSAPFGGCRIAAYLRVPGQPVRVNDALVLETNELAAFDPNEVDDIVIALPPEHLQHAPEIARLLDPLCRPMRAILDIGNHPATSPRWFQFGDLQMMDLEYTPAESPGYTIFKRLFDVAFSALALILAAPLMLAIAGTIKLSSPGPVLFRQKRMGLNGRTFFMYKFRTMRVGSQQESDTRWTTADDPRRTAIGSLLRRSSLDELPQFLNVLRGEMSVVGPRPERPHFVERFQRDIAQYHQRHRVKVGITGWAQVNGLRGDTSIRRRVEYDLHYLHHWSLTFDLRIIARTIWSGFFGSNAY
jgi:Undecaprenyl-phosphate glucose phosphotransferase